MRARVTLVIVVLAALSACATDTERPEGIVERWIDSMNQGPAGEPWAWADDEATAEVSPTWDTDDPGTIDAFAVGAATPTDGGFVVPFEIERLDGLVTRGDAVLARRELDDGSSELVVIEVRLGETGDVSSGWRTGASGMAWLLAIAAAILFTVVGVLVVQLVRTREEEPV